MTLPSRHRIRKTLEVWGRARYLSDTEAPHNTEFYEWIGKKHFCFFQTTEKRTPIPSLKASGANHYPRAPALVDRGPWKWFQSNMIKVCYICHNDISSKHKTKKSTNYNFVNKNDNWKRTLYPDRADRTAQYATQIVRPFSILAHIEPPSDRRFLFACRRISFRFLRWTCMKTE